MIHRKKKEVSLPTKKQVETERKRYRRQKAYNKALGGTVYVLTIVAAVAVLIATLILPVLQFFRALAGGGIIRTQADQSGTQFVQCMEGKPIEGISATSMFDIGEETEE